MSNLNDNIKLIKTARDNIKTVLTNKGQTVNNDIRTYADAVNNLDDVDTEVATQEQIIAQIQSALDNKTSSADGTRMNIFVQDTEPAIKKGIWLQTNKTPQHYIYDEEVFISGEWTDDGIYSDLPISFTYGRAVAIGTDIYLFDSNTGSSKSAYKYDTLTDTYTQLTNIPFNFYSGGLTNIGTDIYLFGGGGSNRAAYKYDTLTDTYTQLTSIPYQFENAPAVTVGTDIYLIGVIPQSYSYRIYKYDTLTDTYTDVANAINSCIYSSAVAIGTVIYILGERRSTGGYNYVNDYAYSYDTVNGTYTQLTNVPWDFINGGAVAVGTDIYLFGSNSSTTFLQQRAYKYNTLTNAYTQLTNIPYSFKLTPIATVGNKIYLFGYGTKLQVYNLTSKTYEQDNLVVISQGKYKTVGYEIELFSNTKNINYPVYAFADAWYYTTQDGLITTIPTYYGNGTSWVKIKN